VTYDSAGPEKIKFYIKNLWRSGGSNFGSGGTTMPVNGRNHLYMLEKSFLEALSRKSSNTDKVQNQIC
jgi:hypothetical protein